MSKLGDRIGHYLGERVEGEAAPAAWPACAAIALGVAVILLATAEAVGWLNVI